MIVVRTRDLVTSDLLWSDFMATSFNIGFRRETPLNTTSLRLGPRTWTADVREINCRPFFVSGYLIWSGVNHDRGSKKFLRRGAFNRLRD
jgi:hypothetical protein